MNYADIGTIRRVYPNAVGEQEGYGVWDENGNLIAIDESLVNAAAAEVAVENAWKALRRERNKLLAETDYLANTDVTMTDEMRDYRQALRDLPANTSDPSNPTWPTKPPVQ